jgi:hypothetical protein
VRLTDAKSPAPRSRGGPAQSARRVLAINPLVSEHDHERARQSVARPSHVLMLARNPQGSGRRAKSLEPSANGKGRSVLAPGADPRPVSGVLDELSYEFLRKESGKDAMCNYFWLTAMSHASKKPGAPRRTSPRRCRGPSRGFGTPLANSAWGTGRSRGRGSAEPLRWRAGVTRPAGRGAGVPPSRLISNGYRSRLDRTDVRPSRCWAEVVPCGVGRCSCSA